MAGNFLIHERTSKRLTIEGATRNRPRVSGLRPALFYRREIEGKGEGASLSRQMFAQLALVIAATALED
jgi:hypothetical protein